MTGKRITAIVKWIVYALIAMAVIVFCATAVKNISAGQNSAGRDQLEEAIRRSAAACYAAEGYYPPTIDYIKEHYGIQVDDSHYTVFYDIFAENLMPDITVLEK